MTGRAFRYTTSGLLAAAILLVIFWLGVLVVTWRYGSPHPGQGQFLDTTLGGQTLIGKVREDGFWISYLYYPYRSNFTAPWDSRLYGVVNWAWVSVEWIPTYPPPEGPPGGFGNVNVTVRFNAFRMLLLSVLLLAGAVLAVALRRRRLRRESSRPGFEAIVGVSGSAASQSPPDEARQHRE